MAFRQQQRRDGLGQTNRHKAPVPLSLCTPTRKIGAGVALRPRSAPVQKLVATKGEAHAPSLFGPSIDGQASPTVTLTQSRPPRPATAAPRRSTAQDSYQPPTKFFTQVSGGRDGKHAESRSRMAGSRLTVAKSTDEAVSHLLELMRVRQRARVYVSPTYRMMNEEHDDAVSYDQFVGALRKVGVRAPDSTLYKRARPALVEASRAHSSPSRTLLGRPRPPRPSLRRAPPRPLATSHTPTSHPPARPGLCGERRAALPLARQSPRR